MKVLYHRRLGIKKEELCFITDKQVKDIYEKKLNANVTSIDESIDRQELEEAYEQLKTESKRKEYYSYITKEPAEIMQLNSFGEILFLSDERIMQLYRNAKDICETQRKEMEQSGEDTTLLSYYKDYILELAQKGLKDPEERTRYFIKRVLDPVYVQDETKRIRDLSKKPTSTPIYNFYDEMGRKVEVYYAGELEYVDSSEDKEQIQLYMLHKQMNPKLSKKQTQPEIECVATSTDFKNKKNESMIPHLLSDRNIKIAKEIARSRGENADRKSIYVGTIGEQQGRRAILFDLAQFTAIINFNLERNMEKREKEENHKQKEE